MHLYTFFEQHQHLFKKAIGKVNPNSTDYGQILRQLEGVQLHWTYGKCYPIAQFVFYYLGGYGGSYDLKCIKKMPITINGVEFTTSHWFVQHKEDGSIIDLTAEQFYGYADIPYERGRRANFGFPWIKDKDGVKHQLPNCAPSLQALRLYKAYREIEIVPNLERYYKICKIA